MFDKIKFSQIIKEIKETYNSQEEFSKKSGIGRTYLSQYMNMKLDEPPKPKMLEKLAKSSNGVTSYNELMKVCGYIDDNYFYNLHNLHDNYHEIESNFSKNTRKIVLSEDEEEIYDDLSKIINTVELSHLNEEKQNNELDTYFTNMDYLSNESKQKIKNKLKILIKYSYEIEKYFKNVSELKSEHRQNLIDIDKDDLLLSGNYYNNTFFNIPVIGKIAAGQPILAEEYIEGYLPVDPNVYGMKNPKDYFYLKVSGESMNLKIKNGDYALIRKQDTAEDGDIVVAIVNSDDEATLKRYKKLNEQFVLLEPMSNDPSIEAITVDLKNTKFQIIGKAIGQFGKF